MADNQFQLLGQRRFGPLFVTQFLGAFNDNVYRNALITLVTFLSVGLSDGEINTLINLAAALVAWRMRASSSRLRRGR